jgi:hypothetical protein
MISLYFAPIISLLEMIEFADYAKPSNALSDSSIGQHIRHSIEMYTCLVDNYEAEQVDYSLRKRDITLESSPLHALESFNHILKAAEKEDKSFVLISDGIQYKTSYYRELLYCNEHLVHHLALIKVALNELGKYSVNENFGVASSTIKYRQSCVQ